MLYLTAFTDRVSYCIHRCCILLHSQIVYLTAFTDRVSYCIHRCCILLHSQMLYLTAFTDVVSYCIHRLCILLHSQIVYLTAFTLQKPSMVIIIYKNVILYRVPFSFNKILVTVYSIVAPEVENPFYTPSDTLGI